ncbi:acyl-CoA dehydrogenase family protein [Streptomyces sp. NBC_00893]|uniref:acyl-CoA dehydrogenase family protein n=1 Tax=Streptomyces sp. NBC_00893 TaxID=2975862 RepID=UPI00225A6A62|nr:acyl-CoA dehydrogenase [Streptomyces sp. NBC_00893]MCX4849512.1 acyl-CoA dehydrogenase [Streptomyces sp. NBC_00893]
MTTRAQVSSVQDVVASSAELARAALARTTGADFRTRWKALVTQGLLSAGSRAPAAGSGGPGPVTTALATIEGIGLAGAPAGLCYALASQRFGIQHPLQSMLSEQALHSLGDVTSGDVLLCHALTEEGGGSDPLSMSTSAERQADGSYLLTGMKSFVTAAPVADIGLVFARTSADRNPFALSAFLVDLRVPEVKRSEPFAKTALTEVPMGSLTFGGVRLAPDRLVGQEGSGLALLTVTTAWERAMLLSYALGPMRHVLDRTVDWCKSREHFGRKMGSSHLVAARVADMALALHRSRELVYRMAARLDAGERPRHLAAAAALTKISVAEDYVMFTKQAAMLGGVRSFIEDSGLCADLISPMAASTYAGPNDLLRVTVARELGLPVEN